MSASSPRISSSQQGFLLVVYLIHFFNEVATWKRITQSKPMQAQRIISSLKKN
jgi:hypothetical protein